MSRSLCTCVDRACMTNQLWPILEVYVNGSSYCFAAQSKFLRQIEPLLICCIEQV